LRNSSATRTHPRNLAAGNGRNPEVDSDPGAAEEMGSGDMTATEVAAMLDLKPHPEGGYYAETFRDSSVSLTTDQLPPQCMCTRPIPQRRFQCWLFLSRSSV
jgi:hypothetical protein